MEVPTLLVLEEPDGDKAKPNLSRIANDGYAGVIIKPFSSEKLCNIIVSTLKIENKNCHLKKNTCTVMSEKNKHLLAMLSMTLDRSNRV